MGKTPIRAAKSGLIPTEKLTAITIARVFVEERAIDERTVLIDGSHIRAVGGAVSEIYAICWVIDSEDRVPDSRKARTSLTGGCPKKRLYSRLN